jgi:dihydroorotase
MDLILEARAFFRGSLTDVEIGIDEEHGTIAAIKKSLSGSPRKSLKGKLLLPSAVDWHVHFRDPGAPKKEDFDTGTRGAALGGVGLVLDMPNTHPIIDRASRLRDKAETVARKANVDWGLWGTVTDATPDPAELARMAAGLKLYLAPTTNAEAAPGDEAILRMLRAAAVARRWVAVHAEGTPDAAPAGSTRAHDQRRPAQGEVDAIQRLLGLSAPENLIHIAHTTTAQAIAAASQAGFSTGSTPHHLLLSYEDVPGPPGKVNPPLRSREQSLGLLRAFAQGQVRHLESDHAPHTIDEKAAAFDEAPAGIPGVQTMLPLLLARAKKGDVPIAEVVRAACERPGADLGVGVGRLEVGADATFIVIDSHQARPVRAAELASRSEWSPFEGMPAIFPQQHYLRGEMIVEDGRFIGRRGQGRQIEPRAQVAMARLGARTNVESN